jgi:hypothetical protein
VSGCVELRRFLGLPEAAVQRVRVEAGARRPGRVVRLEPGELRPPWLPETATPALWLAAEMAREAREGETVLASVLEGEQSRAAVVRSEQGVSFLFDPEPAIAAVLSEAYFEPRRPLHSHLSLPYQLVPGAARLAIFRWLVKRGRAPAAPIPFPEWPMDASVETLRFMFQQACCVAGWSGAGAPPWPDGRRCALVVSHDVDTAAGLRLAGEVAGFEAGLGVRSCWFVVGDLLGRDPALLEALRGQGHEIGLHGDRHDNTIAYQSPERIRSRLAGALARARRYEVRGFRSPSLLETPTLRDALGERFAYASQVPDSEVDSLLGPRRGCASLFPFVKRGLLEIPITLPMEDKLIMAGMSEAGILELWRRKAARIQQVGGLIQLAIHNEPHLLRRCRGAYQELLRELSADASIWRATPGELAAWWRASRVDAAA